MVVIETSIDSSLTLHYALPNFTIPRPDVVELSAGDIIHHWGGVKIVRWSDQVAVKYGPSVKAKEAETLAFLAALPISLPVPKLFASYSTIVSSDQEEADFSQTYIFLEYVPGETLDRIWSSLNQVTRVSICHQVGAVVKELRTLEAPSYIGSVNEGPVLDNVVGQIEKKGPYRSIVDFHTVLAHNYARIHKGQVSRYVQGLLTADKQHTVVFTHADLRPADIIVQNGQLMGIIDWEMAGWYPEYWEFAKVFANYGFQNDWGDCMLDVLQPYYAEAAAHSYVSQHLW